MPEGLARHVFDGALSLLALPVLAGAAYLGLLTFLSLLPPRRERRAARADAGTPLRIDVIVPAHDEERGIADTVRSLLATSYPPSAFRILVVADNCSDRTAEAAAAAGALVLRREDRARRGKGHALRYAYDHVLATSDASAVLVVDADTVVSPNLLTAVAERLAAGEQALQAHYAVRDAARSWRTRLLALAFAAMHGVRSLGRERLALSCGLRGNGMALSTELLRQVPHQAWSVVEDLEYGIELGYAGRRVAYLPQAEVRGLMSSSEAGSRSQRRRWEGGRSAIARRHVRPLLRRALAERSALLADLGLDLLVPPLATLTLWIVAGLAACLVAAKLGFVATLASWLYGTALALLLAHVLRAIPLSGVGPRALLDLALVPVYVVWKLFLRVLPVRHHPGEWVRTPRPGEE